MNVALKIKEKKEETRIETRIEDYAEGAMSLDWVMKKTGLSKEEIERKAEEYKKKK